MNIGFLKSRLGIDPLPAAALAGRIGIGESTNLVVLVAITFAVTVAVSMVFIMVVIFSNEVFTVESRSSNFVSVVFTIAKFVKLLDLVPSQAGR